MHEIGLGASTASPDAPKLLGRQVNDLSRRSRQVASMGESEDNPLRFA